MYDLKKENNAADERPTDLTGTWRVVGLRQTCLSWPIRVVRLADRSCEIQASHPFPPGAVVQLCIQGPGGEVQVTALVRAWCRLAGGGFLYRIEFTQRLAPARLAALRGG